MTNDLHMKLARWLRFSKRTSRVSVWLDVFYASKGFIIINFQDGRRLRGWPMYFSDDPNKPYLFLWKPAWIEMDEATLQPKVIELDLEGILVTPEEKIESIEFLKSDQGGSHE